MTRAALLRSLTQNRVVRAMACHSPLSGMIAEEAGFDALWMSGFEVSALYGLPDASFITMSEHLDLTRAVAARTSIPIIADLDTGFGNALNAAHAVREYERAGVAAVVLEDKSFPKMTSLLADGRQELVRTAEFQGKIEATRGARHGELMIIARTEALIAGLGMDEALERATAYGAAGADLILVHSKCSTADEVKTFASRWTGQVGLVVIPTAYPDFTLDDARAMQSVRVVIYGNHAVRASVKAMQQTFAEILETGSTFAVEGAIAPVEEVFRLQGMDGLKADEKRYLR